MFRAADWVAISNKEAPPVFTGTNSDADTILQPSRNLDRGHIDLDLQSRRASVDHLHRAQELGELRIWLGAVTFPATRPPNSRAWPPGFIASTEGRNR